jgi:hypothetical protein
MAAPGGRNDMLNRAPFRLGTFVAGAALDQESTIEALVAAADRCGLLFEDGRASVYATIRSGLRAGRKRPRAVPPSGETTAGSWSAKTAMTNQSH